MKSKHLLDDPGRCFLSDYKHDGRTPFRPLQKLCRPPPRASAPGQGELFAKSRSIPELSVVALRHPVECKGGVLPEGAKGTVVHVYRDGEHYEVEFAEPFPYAITLRRDDIHPE
ncbi:MAG TPA: DUF4926 domain-containing protein [Candidatus Sulfotelmatobacter sp.]|nr:DUF4926 domain-containing protein [Candidatus Sulfotelmatobacter sp.]